MKKLCLVMLKTLITVSFCICIILQLLYLHIELLNLFTETIMDTIKKEGLYDGLLHILLLRMAADVAKQLGMPPGGEFRRAFEEVSIQYIIIEIALSVLQLIRYYVI